jgi:hypothetical protein
MGGRYFIELKIIRKEEKSGLNDRSQYERAEKGQKRNTVGVADGHYSTSVFYKITGPTRDETVGPGKSYTGMFIYFVSLNV